MAEANTASVASYVSGLAAIAALQGFFLCRAVMFQLFHSDLLYFLVLQGMTKLAGIHDACL